MLFHRIKEPLKRSCMDIQQYLERIGYRGTAACDIDTLIALVECHVRKVPFEDLDIQAGIPIALDTKAFFEKVVLNRRGGYCYELNGLFCALLRSLGFEVHMLSARVANGKDYADEYDHMALVVVLDSEQWLVDVGFGDFSLKPLQISNEELQSDGRNKYLIKKVLVDRGEYYSVDRWNEGRDMYVTQYIFSLEYHPLEDFAARNLYQHTDPNSHFTKNLLCSLPTDTGRVSMINNRMIYTEHGEKQEEAIKDEIHREEMLSKYFNIQMRAVYKCSMV